VTPRPLQCFEFANLVAEVSHDLRGCHPNDALGVAQWIATNALRCWAPEDRIPLAGEWCDHVLSTVRESLD
jgi:hypothetical protein